jgi:hypothetical protein
MVDTVFPKMEVALMPRLSIGAVPKYRRHKASGQAIVAIAGSGFYLGPY